MAQLLFFNGSVLDGLPKPERGKLSQLLKTLMIPEGRPFILGGDGLPDPALDGFLDHLIHPSRSSPQTWRTYAEQVFTFIRFMSAQGKSWTEAKAGDLDRYYVVRTSGQNQSLPPITGSSWNVAAAALVLLYEYAQDQGLVAEVPFRYRRGRPSVFASSRSAPVADISVKAAPKPINFIDINTYKSDWRAALAKGRNSQRNLALSDLLISSGLRIQEALNLKVHQIPDPDAKAYAGRKTVTISIVGKRRKRRKVRVPKRVIRAITFYVDEDRNAALEVRQKFRKSPAKTNPDQVFLSERGNPLAQRSVQDLFANTGKGVGVTLTPHGLRHTFAIYQLEAMIKRSAQNLKEIRKGGADAYRQQLQDPLRELQMLLGHAHLSTTYMYLDFLEESEALVDESMDDWTSWESESGR